MFELGNGLIQFECFYFLWWLSILSMDVFDIVLPPSHFAVSSNNSCYLNFLQINKNRFNCFVYYAKKIFVRCNKLRWIGLHVQQGNVFIAQLLSLNEWSSAVRSHKRFHFNKCKFRAAALTNYSLNVYKFLYYTNGLIMVVDGWNHRLESLCSSTLWYCRWSADVLKANWRRYLLA